MANLFWAVLTKTHTIASEIFWEHANKITLLLDWWLVQNSLRNYTKKKIPFMWPKLLVRDQTVICPWDDLTGDIDVICLIYQDLSIYQEFEQLYNLQTQNQKLLIIRCSIHEKFELGPTILARPWTTTNWFWKKKGLGKQPKKVT